MESSEDKNGSLRNTRPYARPPHSADGRRARSDYTCEHCGREFRGKPVHDHRGISPRRFCSKRCAGAHRTAKAAATGMMADARSASREFGMPEHPAELIDMSLAQPLTPGQSAKVRSYIFGLLRAQVPLAHRVVMGEAEWSPTQARVFATLLDKCLPDLAASFVVNEQGESRLPEMSRRDLEALAAGADPTTASA